MHLDLHKSGGNVENFRLVIKLKSFAIYTRGTHCLRLPCCIIKKMSHNLPILMFLKQDTLLAL